MLMLTVQTAGHALNRRDFLRIGTLGLGGLSLPWLLEAQARAALEGKPLTTGKSVIFLFLHGGPSQIETFDPKPTAPEGVRSVTGEAATTLPGVTFGSTFQKLAALAHKIAVVRSYRPGSADHDIKPLVHRETLNASLGSIYARVAGMNHPRTGIPTNVALFPRAVDPKTQAANLSFGNFGATGQIGSAFAPFVPGGTGNLLQNMQLKLSRDRLDDRRHLLGQIDTLRREVDAADTLHSLDRIQQQAFDVILRGVAQAFDLSRENDKTIARYDTAPLVRPENIDRKWKNYNNYVDNAKTVGKLLLLARRLCEAGCGFVTVTTNFVWDMHADVNNAGVAEGMRYMGAPLDHAVSAYIEDVEARGLEERILLVVAGEMGRTPRINKNGGRDHWGNLGPLLLHGGGLKMGQVIGQSTRNGGDPATEPMTIRHLISTLMHTLLHPGEVRIARGIPDDVGRVIADGEPIRGLMN
jgi:Protein of unknown function (DUF1501)